MAQSIILKRSALPGKVPTTSSLNVGEIAVNTYDGKVFINRSGSTQTIQEIITTNVTNTGSIRLTQTGSFGELVTTQDGNIGRDLYVTRDIVGNGDIDIAGNITGSSALLSGNLIITGSVMIGSSSLGPNENTLTLGARDTANEGGQIGFNAPGGTFASASFIDNWSNYIRILRGRNATSTGLVAQWNLHTLQMELPGYTNASSFVGTATANLAVDSSGKVITVSTSGASVFPYTGNAVITGSLTTTGIIYAQPNGGMYFQGGDDAALYDINVANTMGIYGVQDSTVASIKLGSGGGIISGKNGSIGLGTINPSSASLHVTGSIFAASITGAIAATNNVISGSTQITVLGFATTASLNAFTTSVNTFTASNGNTSLNSYTASNNTKWNTIGALTSSFATTGSNGFNGNQTITGSLTVSSVAVISSSLSANSSSLTLSSGSNLYVYNNGFIEVTGSIIVSSGGITGSIAATNGVISGSSQLTASYDQRYALSGSSGAASGPNTFDFNLDPQAAGTVNFIEDSTGNTQVIARTGSMDVEIESVQYLSLGETFMNVTTGSITRNYMHLAKYITTNGDLDFNI